MWVIIFFLIYIIVVLYFNLPQTKCGGEQSKSEARVIQLIEKLLGRKFPTSYPPWLVWKGKQLELDGFDGKIALEFSGPLHTKWSPAVETYEKYFNRIINDEVKIKLCKKNNVDLIIIDYTLPSIHILGYIKSRLYDFGHIDYKPIPYLPLQKPNVYRNNRIENELGLTKLWDEMAEL